MAVEGVFIPQGCDNKFFSWRYNSFYKLLIAILFIAIFASTGQAGLFSKRNHTYNSPESENLSRRIKQLVCELEYPEKVAENFVTMFDGFKGGEANQFFAARREKLHQIREDYKQGNAQIASIVKIEESIIEDINWLLENEFSCADEYFELPDVIRNRQASCLGFTQLFYILGDSIGLSVIPINVFELQRPGPLPTGAAHVSCIVGLSDGRKIMLDSVSAGLASKPFIMQEKFTKIGNYWQLTDKDNLLDLYRKIQLLDRDGLIAYIYSNRGTVYASAGQFNKAITSYNRAIKLNPNFADAYNHRGIAHRNLSRINQAVSDYTKAIGLKPNYTEAYNNRGVAYEKLGQIEQSIRDYDKSIELNPKLAEAYNNRANSHAKLRQFDQAVSDYTKAIKNNSKFAEAYANRAVIYALTGKTKGARKDLLKAAELNPDLEPKIAVLSQRFKLDIYR